LLSYKIDRIISYKHDDNGDPWYLVKWKRYGHKHNTWEPVKNIIQNDTINKYWRKSKGNEDEDMSESKGKKKVSKKGDQKRRGRLKR
jgi:hypothetical protein